MYYIKLGSSHLDFVIFISDMQTIQEFACVSHIWILYPTYGMQ